MAVKTEKVKLSEIHELEDNPRWISEKEFERLKKSIKDFPEMLEVREIVVDENGTILGGNQRYKALLANGETEAIIKRAIGWTDEMKRQFVIKDNHANGSWDEDMLANNWSDCPLEEWMGDEYPEDWSQTEEKEIIEDDVPELPKEPKAKRGDIYQLGNHRLMCGDSTKEEDVVKLMNGEIADLVFTDPPYNVAVQNSQGMTIENDNMKSSEFRLFLDKAFACLSSNLKPGGAFYIWHADSESVNFRESARENGLVTKQCLIWVKNSFNFGRQDYKWQHEPCLYGWKDGAAHYFIEEYNHPTVIEDAVDIDKLSKADLQTMLKEMLSDNVKKTVIHEDKPLKNDLHPTMKPLKMCGDMIKNSSRERESTRPIRWLWLHAYGMRAT